MEKIANLVAKSYDASVAAAYRAFTPTEKDRQSLAETGRDVLANVPHVPGACAIMSALYLARWEMSSTAPAFVVAGELHVNTTRVFGGHGFGKDSKPAFSSSNLSWDGHCWLQFGEYVADVSVFHTASHKGSPPALTEFMKASFGSTTGLLLGHIDHLAQGGLRYDPLYVLTRGEVDGLLLGAESLFRPE